LAQFKKVPDGGEGPVGELTQGTGELLGQLAIHYWPIFLGGITLFLLVVLGYERATIPVAIAIVVLQAWLILG
jgi:hypothetical protein